MFEGSEKKLEIILAPKARSFRSLPGKFWEGAARACGARVIETAKFPHIDSRILSESSLFVWDRRAVFITCGTTSLPKALLKILKKFSADEIGAVFYQRKNEFFPWIQKNSFEGDLKAIQKKLKGVSYRFGPLHSHHCFLFHSETDFRPEPDERTTEILMYDSQTVKDCLPQTIRNLKKRLAGLFPDFEIQEHVFDPAGYSLNAVRDFSYYTIHITPEKSFFYISFEANIQDRAFIGKILDLFRARSFDLLLFTPSGQGERHYSHPDFARAAFFHQALSCGYEVSYMSFNQAQSPPRAPALYGAAGPKA